MYGFQLKKKNTNSLYLASDGQNLGRDDSINIVWLALNNLNQSEHDDEN